MPALAEFLMLGIWPSGLRAAALHPAWPIWTNFFDETKWSLGSCCQIRAFSFFLLGFEKLWNFDDVNTVLFFSKYFNFLTNLQRLDMLGPTLCISEFFILCPSLAFSAAFGTVLGVWEPENLWGPLPNDSKQTNFNARVLVYIGHWMGTLGHLMGMLGQFWALLGAPRRLCGPRKRVVPSK